jgi:hypothetical protein
LSDQIHNDRLIPAAWAITLLLCCSVVAPDGSAVAGEEAAHIHWKQVTEAQVKVDDKVPLTWNVSQPDTKPKKDSNLVLILLGHRYVLLDLKAKVVYEVPLSKLPAPGKDFDSGELPGAARLIPSSNWMLRDIGPAEMIQFTLGDYGRVLTLALPHPPDIRLGIY